MGGSVGLERKTGGGPDGSGMGPLDHDRKTGGSGTPPLRRAGRGHGVGPLDHDRKTGGSGTRPYEGQDGGTGWGRLITTGRRAGREPDGAGRGHGVGPLDHERKTGGSGTRRKTGRGHGVGPLDLERKTGGSGTRPYERCGVARLWTTSDTTVGLSWMLTVAWPMVVGRTQRMRPFWTFLSRSMASRTWAGSTPV